MVTFRKGIESYDPSMRGPRATQDAPDGGLGNETNVPFFRNNVKQRGTTTGPDLSSDERIHPSFPSQGSEQRSYEGSQSTPPQKEQ